MADESFIPDFLDRKKNPLPPSPVVNIPAEVVVEQPRVIKGVLKPFVGVRTPKVEDRASALIAELEGFLDDGIIDDDWSLYDYLLKNDQPVTVAALLQNHFVPQFEELGTVLCTLDEDLLFAYSHMTKDEVRAKAKLFLKMIDEAQLFIDNKKKTHLPKKRTRSAQKIVKGLSYMQKHDKHRLVSIDPIKIVGAKELWTFNTTNFLLTVYRAVDNSRLLTLKGSNVIHVDEEKSYGRVIRNIDESLKVVLESNKTDVKKMMDALTTIKQIPKRITKNTILLRVF